MATVSRWDVMAYLKAKSAHEFMESMRRVNADKGVEARFTGGDAVGYYFVGVPVLDVRQDVMLYASSSLARLIDQHAKTPFLALVYDDRLFSAQRNAMIATYASQGKLPLIVHPLDNRQAERGLLEVLESYERVRRRGLSGVIGAHEQLRTIADALGGEDLSSIIKRGFKNLN